MQRAACICSSSLVPPDSASFVGLHFSAAPTAVAGLRRDLHHRRQLSPRPGEPSRVMPTPDQQKKTCLLIRGCPGAPGSGNHRFRGTAPHINKQGVNPGSNIPPKVSHSPASGPEARGELVGVVGCPVEKSGRAVSLQKSSYTE